MLEALFEDWFESEIDAHILSRLFNSARNYIRWLTARQIDLRVRAAMMSTTQANLTREVEFLNVIRKVCSDFILDMRASEYGWNKKDRAVFLLLKFRGTPNEYFSLTDDIDVIAS